MVIAQIAAQPTPRPTHELEILLSGATAEQAGSARLALAEGSLETRISGVVDTDALLDGGSVADADAVVLFAAGSRGSSTNTVRALVGALGEVPLIVVVSEGSDALVRAAVKAGASGVVLEQDLPETLPVAVTAACAGMVSVPRDLRRHIERQALSNREKQILALVVMGFTNGEIGRRLFVAESTVKSHLSSAFMKLGVRSRNEAAALILDPAEGLGMGILRLSGAGAERQAAGGTR